MKGRGAKKNIVAVHEWNNSATVHVGSGSTRIHEESAAIQQEYIKGVGPYSNIT